MHHCRYFSQQWMEAMPPNTWNHFNNVGSRTNNHFEGYHRKLNLEFNRSHLSIYRLIGILQNHEVEYRVKVGLGILGSLVSAHYRALFFRLLWLLLATSLPIGTPSTCRSIRASTTCSGNTHKACERHSNCAVH